jgi:hypothetical protein
MGFESLSDRDSGNAYEADFEVPEKPVHPGENYTQPQMDKYIEDLAAYRKATENSGADNEAVATEGTTEKVRAKEESNIILEKPVHPGENYTQPQMDKYIEDLAAYRKATEENGGSAS